VQKPSSLEWQRWCPRRASNSQADQGSGCVNRIVITVQIAIIGAVVWLMLRLTQHFAGRAAFWALGLLLFLFPMFWLFRLLRK
jgi:hypothetical protein